MTNKLKQFLETATLAEVAACAREARTTVRYLHYLAGGYGGGRVPSVTIAVGIEKATKQMARDNKRRTPVVTCDDIARLAPAAVAPSSNSSVRVPNSAFAIR